MWSITAQATLSAAARLEGDMTEQKPRLIDATISLQTLLLSGGTVIAAGVLAWFTLTGRVAILEDHDKSHDQHFARIESETQQHFSRIESDMQQQRLDMKDQLKSIGSDVKDTNSKIDALRDQLSQNSAGNRPDIRRWSK